MAATLKTNCPTHSLAISVLSPLQNRNLSLSDSVLTICSLCPTSPISVRSESYCVCLLSLPPRCIAVALSFLIQSIYLHSLSSSNISCSAICSLFLSLSLHSLRHMFLSISSSLHLPICLLSIYLGSWRNSISW